MVKIFKNSNVISDCIYNIVNEIINWYINTKQHINYQLVFKKKKVSFDENIKIRLIKNIEDNIYNVDQKVIQSIEIPKIKIFDNHDDFDFFVFFE